MAVGAKIRWRNGDIIHPSTQWKSPSMRRIPRLLIERRAQEVGVLIYIQDAGIVFHETRISALEIDLTDAVLLEYYAKHYHLLPEKVYRQDTYEWLQKPQNALILWAREANYYVKPVKKDDFSSI